MTADTGATRRTTGRHTVYMEQRKQLQVTGVTEVFSFHENEIMLQTHAATMVVTGEELHIGKLLLEEGKVEVNGQIEGVVYEKPKTVRRLAWRNRKK